MNRFASAVMIVLVIMMLACVAPSYSADTEYLLAPASLKVLPGQAFTVDVRVNNVSSLFNWQLVTKYNGTIVNCTAAWVPDDNVFAGHPPIHVDPILNSATNDGYNYTIFGLSLSGSDYVPFAEGTLCKLNFTALQYGQTALTLATVADPVMPVKIHPYDPASPPPVYSFLLNPNLEEMPFIRENSQVTSGDLQTLTILTNAHGITSPASGNYTYVYGTNVSVTAISDNDFVFDHWTLNDSVEYDHPISVAMTSNYTLKPFFVSVNYTLTVIESANGTFSLSSGDHYYEAGTTVQLVATSDVGYRLAHWVLDGSDAGSDNPLSLVMNSNHTLGAVFSPVSYVGTIYIRTDGTIDPDNASISTLDNTTYTLSENVNSMIVVQRSNVVIDGNGKTLQGSGSGEGISLIVVNNVTLRNLNIRGFGRGVYLVGALKNVISGNNITSNALLGVGLYGSSNNSICFNSILANGGDGVRLDYSSNYNSVLGNSISNNNVLGIYIDSSLGNIFYHNNLLNNPNQVHVDASLSGNIWDDGAEGNCWSNYAGADLNYDGVGDVPFVIAVNNTDHYPLMGTISSFRSQSGETIEVFSNSTVKNFEYSVLERKMSLDVEGAYDTFGFCNIAIPHNVIDPAYLQVVIDNGLTPVLQLKTNLRDNSTHRWVYFAYTHSTHTIVIQEDSAPPLVSVVSPENMTYSTGDVVLTFTVDESISWSGYSLDSGANVTITGNTTLTGLSDGSHNVVVYSNDTVGNMAVSNNVFFSVDTAPPLVTVLSPENKTYATRDVVLTFAVNESTSWTGYSVDGWTNVTVAGNTTITALSEGVHSLVVYANDTVGNSGSSETAIFLVDVTPPNITQVTQSPTANSVFPEDIVTVTVIMTDNVTAIKSVILNYTYTDGSGSRSMTVTMTNAQADVWIAALPALAYGTNVTYTIWAEDNAGNFITTKDVGYTFSYSVIPEYSASCFVAVLLVFALFSTLLARRKLHGVARVMT